MIETSLVHIYNMASPAQFVGCGAMVEGGYIATCRHVWRKASDEQGVVTVAFPYAIEDQKPAARPGTLADACETDANEPVVDLVLLRVDDPPDKLRGTGLQITRDPDFESGEAYALARIPTKKIDTPIKGEIAPLLLPDGLRNFGVGDTARFWLEKSSSGSPVILKNPQKLAGLVRIADVKDKQEDVKFHEAFIVPGTTIWRFVSAAQAHPVAERENVDIGKLRELLAQMGHDDVRADEIPAKLAEAFKAMQARGAEQVAPSNAGADIDATIAAARAKLRESDPQGALALLKAKRAEETQARVQRETALLAEQAAVERLAYDYAGAKATLEELLRLDSNAVSRWGDLGDLWLTTGNLAEASRAYGAALDAARRQGLASEESVALARLGDVSLKQGKLADALQSHRDGLVIAERLALADPDDTLQQRSLSVSHNKIGDVLVAQGKLTEALQSYRADLAIAERLARAHPGDAQLQSDLSVSYDKMGNISFQQGKLEDALRSFGDSLRIGDRLARTYPDNMDWLRELSVNYCNVGDVFLAQGRPAEALTSHRAQLSIIEPLAQDDPDNTLWQRDLSTCHNKIGDALAVQGKLAEALQSYRASLAIRAHLAQTDPDNSEWRRDLAVVNERIGEMLLKQGDAKGALEAFERALDAYRKLLESNPDDVRALLFSVIPHWRLAGLDKAKAREHLEAALAILEPMAAQDRLDAQRRGWIGPIKTQLAALGDPAA